MQKIADSKRDAREQVKALVAAGILEPPRYFGASSKGGQHANRTMSSVKLVGRWTRPDGSELVIRCRACLKSQGASLAAALSEIKARHRREVERLRQPGRGSVGAMGDKYVRTYHQPDNRVLDHVSGRTMSWDAVVRKNDLGPMIEARRNAKGQEG